MTRVAISGAGGRMGRWIAEAISAAADLELVALYDPGHGGDTVAGVVVSSDPIVVGEATVVVEVTNPDVVMGNLEQWRRLGVNAVVGTSGFGADRLAAAEAAWGSGPPNCIVVPNFSVGAVLMMRFAEVAAAHFSGAEIIELHHEDKPDAPSGTSLATAGRMTSAVFESTELVAGARGAAVGDVRVHSVRLPGLLAHQEVILGNKGETLTIRHDTSDYASFMPGVLLAVRSVAGLAAFSVGLEQLLFKD
jgi:4-hydroxy-tetrahydrodipicolinate reductase